MSTYGEGDPPDNSSRFLEWVRTEEAKLIMAERLYAAIGFGNSNYKYYNRVVDTLDFRLQQLSATRLIPIRRVDASAVDCQEMVVVWKDGLFDTIQNMFSIRPTLLGQFEPRFSVVEAAHDSHSQLDTKQPRKLPGYTQYDILSSAKVMDADDQCCLHFELSPLEKAGFQYRTGDYLQIMPPNPAQLVDDVLRICNLFPTAHLPLRITSIDHGDSPDGLPSVTTAYELCHRYLDITSPISRDSVALLNPFAPTHKSREMLQHYSQKDKFSQLGRINFSSFLRLVDSDHEWNIPVAFLLDFFTHIKSRFYSISSSSTEHPRQLSLTVSIPLKGLGLATSELLGQHNSLHAQGKSNEPTPYLTAAIKTSNFRLPRLNSLPIILIAAGTGLAPFRAFIQERVAVEKLGKPSGKIVLFFGCRRPQDFLYRSELDEYQKILGDRLIFHPAYSRTGERMYVQEKIRQNIETVRNMTIDQNATLYICGAAAMARDVKEVLSTEMKKILGWGDSEWIAFKDSRKRLKKWQEDVW